MNYHKLWFFCVISLLITGLAAPQSPETPAVSDKEIVFGQSMAFTGKFKMYAHAIQRGIEAGFKQVNQAGGVNGKTLRLVSLDDAGNSVRFAKNIQQLQTKFKISMFLGLMDTSSVLSLLPLMKEGKVAVFFPWAQHKDLQDPQLTTIVNGPGLLEPQLEALAQSEAIKTKKVAIFHTDDNFSTRWANFLAERLKANGQAPLAIESFNFFTMDVAAPATELIKKAPKIIICVCTATPVVELIKYFFEHGSFGTQFFGIDSTFPVKDILSYTGAAFYYASSVPDPATSDIPLAVEYRQAMSSFFPDEPLSILSFTYYLCARIIIDALQKASDSSKEAIIQNIVAMKKTELGGYPLDFDPNTRFLFGKKTWII
ncbi:MAG: ABC transporter substrate-binding protein [Candidatus Babeliales bacterium]|jgi:ABC-type branched-subunit amino acid transport system substrate-binding protein